jgi:hypothetical protein
MLHFLLVPVADAAVIGTKTSFHAPVIPLKFFTAVQAVILAVGIFLFATAASRFDGIY